MVQTGGQGRWILPLAILKLLIKCLHCLRSQFNTSVTRLVDLWRFGRLFEVPVDNNYVQKAF